MTCGSLYIEIYIKCGFLYIEIYIKIACENKNYVLGEFQKVEVVSSA